MTRNRNLLLSPFPAFLPLLLPSPLPNQMHAFPPPPFHLNYSTPFFCSFAWHFGVKREKESCRPSSRGDTEFEKKWWKLCNEDDSSFYFPPLVARQFSPKLEYVEPERRVKGKSPRPPSFLDCNQLFERGGGGTLMDLAQKNFGLRGPSLFPRKRRAGKILPPSTFSATFLPSFFLLFLLFLHQSCPVPIPHHCPAGRRAEGIEKLKECHNTVFMPPPFMSTSNRGNASLRTFVSPISTRQGPSPS